MCAGILGCFSTLVLVIFLRITVFFNLAKSTRFYRPEIMVFVWGKIFSVNH